MWLWKGWAVKQSPTHRWLNMKDRAVFYHSIIVNKKPSYLYTQITFGTDVYNLNIRYNRYKGILTSPCHRIAMFEWSCVYNITKLYNSL